MLTSLLSHVREVGFWPWVPMGLILFVLVGTAAFLLPPILLVAMLAAAAVVLVWLLLPEVLIVIMLLARSSVDGFMELFTLFAGSPLSMNLSGAVNSLAVGLGILCMLRRLARRQSLLVGGPGRAFALFLLVCMASIPGSVDPAGGIKEWARLASGLAIYLLVTEVVHDERRARRFVVVLMASSVIPLALAWFQRLTGQGYFFLGFVGTEFAYRPQGTFAHPAALGAYLVILLTLAVGIYVTERSATVRALTVAWAGLAVSCLALTLARTQWLGMLTAMLVVGFLKRLRLTLLALTVTLLLLLAVPLLRERATASESVIWRLDLWQAASQLAWPPTLLGVGLANSPWHINMLLPNVGTPPHNDYLKVAIELGFLGFLTYAAWLLTLLRHAWRAFRRGQDRPLVWRALGLFAIVLAGLVMSLTDNYLGHTAVQWYLWALVALVPSSGQWPAAVQGRSRNRVNDCGQLSAKQPSTALGPGLVQEDKA